MKKSIMRKGSLLFILVFITSCTSVSTYRVIDSNLKVHHYNHDSYKDLALLKVGTTTKLYCSKHDELEDITVKHIHLNVKQDTVGQVFAGVPSINTNEIETEVLVDNGETLVLGGIFQTTRQRTEDQTPLLGDVPLLGRLFQRRQSADRKQELLIFITPRIVDGEGSDESSTR